MALEDALGGSVVLSRVDKALGWARKYSLFLYPFVTACCGMEFMSTAASHYDLDRFGAALPRFSPRQADVLFVVGTISQKQAPVLKRVWEQMCESGLSPSGVAPVQEAHTIIMPPFKV
jgi:NADH-quinone oxidoreductase subunit B